MFLRKYKFLILLSSLALVILMGCLGNTQKNLVSESASSSPPAPSQVTEQSATDDPISLGIPVQCELSNDCFIMHYVDLDPTEAAVDFGCGRQTYDSHKGTDFAVADLQVAEVPVIAVATGRVLRLRDGVPDILVNTESQKQALANQECGNGVVIGHGDGWETQYCHLKQGSIKVKSGSEVEQGQVLGTVGASGLASFPHVHLSLRHQGQVVDPFVGEVATSGCATKTSALWSTPLKYQPTGIIDAGFTPQPPSQEELWQGQIKKLQVTATSPALVFWVHSYGVLQGDREQWKLTAPNQQVIEQENKIEKPYRSWLGYVGKKNISPGNWRGEYQLWRDGQLLWELTKDFVVE